MMAAAKRIFFSTCNDLWAITRYCGQGIARGKGWTYIKHLLRLSRQSLHLLRLNYVNDAGAEISPGSRTVMRLAERVGPLHALLPPEGYSYSILIPTYHPRPDFFEIALRSALGQSAPDCEVLVGFDGPQSEAVEAVVQRLSAEPGVAGRLRCFSFDRETTGGGISRTTNALAQEARGRFLLLMDHDDWIRPDLLYRYELTLRMQNKPEQTVLFCNEYKIDERNRVIPASHYWKPEHPFFPYIFINSICHCLLVPRALWIKVGGLRPECDGAQDFDLSLRLDVAGALFQNVPLFLYAWRAHAASTAQALGVKDYATPAGVQALRDYARAKGLAWEVEPGVQKTTYRAKPRLSAPPQVHAVVLFHDQRELTLRCIEHLRTQRNVHINITAVDNRSSDTSIGETLRQLDVEVLDIDEGFNFSRLNNRAIRESRYAGPAEQPLLFINNDVELEPDAVEELCRWAQYEDIGAVGARLHYPNGALQHGGVDLHHLSSAHEMTWYHIDAGQAFELAGFSRVTHVCAAVTAACCVVRRGVFEQVGGFDEVYYPIAYSDTNFCVKLQQIGLACLYTPFAVGVHHEGASRGVGSIEDFEKSRWLHTQLLRRNGFKSSLTDRHESKIFGAY